MSANGYLRPDELTTVQGDMQLRNDTARAWNAMKAAAAKDGVTLTIARPEGDYRSWATQLDMRAHPSRYNITPGIVPGLPSEHGLGICVDVASGLAWVKEHGDEYGFTFPLAKTDPNHARYDGVTVPAGESGTLITADAPAPSRTDTDMRFARVTLNASGNHYMGYLIGPNGIIDQIDNQEGWDGKTAFADNAIYARYETLYGAGLNRADYTFTPDQWTAMHARIGTWTAPAGGVTNVTVDNTAVLEAIKAIPVPPRAFVAQP